MIRYDKIRTIMGGNYASVSKIHLDLLLVSDCNSDQLPLFKYSNVIKINTIYVGFRIIITSIQVESKSLVYHGSATSPGQSV